MDRLRWAHLPVARLMGARLAEDISDTDGAAYAAARADEGVKPGTVRTEIAALRAALNWAAGKHRISHAVALDLPAAAPPRDRWLTRAEADRLLEACHGRHVRLFVMLGLHTAARSGAILGLTWRRVDLERRTIDYTLPPDNLRDAARALVGGSISAGVRWAER